MAESKSEKSEKTVAPLSTEDTIRSAVKAAVAESVAVGMTIVREGAKVAQETKATNRTKCAECRQYRMACHGKHIEAVIFPKNRRLVRPGWKGIKLNGIYYRSNSAVHKIKIPAKSPILNMLIQWENAEEEMSISKDLRQNLGTMSPVPGRTRIHRF